MISTGVCYEPTTISAGYRHLYFTTPMQLTECISREWCSRITHPSHVATGTGPNHAKMTIRGPHGRTLHTHTHSCFMSMSCFWAGWGRARDVVKRGTS